MASRTSPLTRYMQRALLGLSVLICVVAVAGLLFNVSGTRTHRFRFRLVPADGRVSPADLERTSAIITARLKGLGGSLGARGGTARPVPPDAVEVQFDFAPNERRGIQDILAWLTMQGRIEFRLLHPAPDSLEDPEDPPPGYETLTFRTLHYDLVRAPEMDAVQEQFVVEERPALQVGDLADISMHSTGLKQATVLTFHFREPDARAFARLTALHPGREMLMLVDGHIFFPPREIESAITGDSVQAHGFFYNPPLKKLVRVLRLGALPAPLERVETDAE